MLTRWVLLLVVGICWTDRAEGRPRQAGPSHLLKKSDVIAIVKLTELPDAAHRVNARVLGMIRGAAQNDLLTLHYPVSGFETLDSYVSPQAGQVLLVFLRSMSDGTYAPTSAYVTIRKLARDGSEIEEDVFSSAEGIESLKSTVEEDVDAVSRLLKDYLRWDELGARQRAELLRASLQGPIVTRRIALDWLVHDRRIDFDKRAEVADEILEGLVSNVKDQNPQIRQKTIQAIALASTTRKELVPYLVDALDDPLTCSIAVNRLDGRRGWGPGPKLADDMTLGQRTAILRKWWLDDGAKRPSFRRFVTPPDGKKGN